jgi:predicted metal-binding protein
MNPKSLSYVSEPAFKKTAEQVESDLNILEKKALELGADRAAIITTDKIVVDERAPWKCKRPTCVGYGRNLSCPPFAMRPEETRELVKKYKFAILARKEPKPQEVMNPPEVATAYVSAPTKEMEKFWEEEHDMNRIISQLEGEAFHMGYYFATSFKPGPCFICGFVKAKEKGEPIRYENLLTCPGVKEGRCIHDWVAKDAMEGAGIDVYATVSNAGWPIYVLGMRTDPALVPSLGLHALLLVH